MRELLAADPEGVSAAADLFGPAREALLEGAQAVVEGGWDRRAMRRVEHWALARSVGEPWTVAHRLRFTRVWKQRCPVICLVRERDRRLPLDPEGWLRDVERGHEVVWTRESIP